MTRCEPSKQQLQAAFETHKTTNAVAKYFKTSHPTIRKWAAKHGIERLSHKQASEVANNRHRRTIKPTRDELLKHYTQLSIDELETKYHVGQRTIYQWLEEYRIELIQPGTKASAIKKRLFDERFPDKDTIVADYQRAGNIEVLARLYNCSYASIRKLLSKHQIPTIAPRVSIGQIEVAEYCRSLGVECELNDRSLINPHEIDILIPSNKLAIEYCGLYWHSQTYGNKSRNYHADKTKRAAEKGYKLITIFENEWHTSRDIVQSVLKTKLQLTSRKLYARDCKFEVLSYEQLKPFEDANHMQGSRPGSLYCGLFHRNELVMTMSFGAARFDNIVKTEMLRMTNKIDTVVVGGASKLFHNSGVGPCVTYCDRRYGTGDVYNSLGFTFSHTSNPNYWYFDRSTCNQLFSRVKFQKHKLPTVLANFDPNVSEYENMLANGWDRIWDCGNNVFYKYDTN